MTPLLVTGQQDGRQTAFGYKTSTDGFSHNLFAGSEYDRCQHLDTLANEAAGLGGLTETHRSAVAATASVTDTVSKTSSVLGNVSVLALCPGYGTRPRDTAENRAAQKEGILTVKQHLVLQGDYSFSSCQIGMVRTAIETRNKAILLPLLCLFTPAYVYSSPYATTVSLIESLLISLTSFRTRYTPHYQ